MFILRALRYRSLDLCAAWSEWSGAPRFLIVYRHRSHVVRDVVAQLGAQGTTLLVDPVEASWTRGLVEGHGSYARAMAERMVQNGVPHDVSAHSSLDKTRPRIKENQSCS